MKFILQVIFTSFLSYMLQPFLAPWIVVVIAGLVTLPIKTSASSAFLGGFVAISLLWMCKATIIDVHTNSILSTKIANLIGINSSILLILLTGTIGGILGGLGALSGQQLIHVLRKTKGSSYRI